MASHCCQFWTLDIINGAWNGTLFDIPFTIAQNNEVHGKVINDFSLSFFNSIVVALEVISAYHTSTATLNDLFDVNILNVSLFILCMFVVLYPYPYRYNILWHHLFDLMLCDTSRSAWIQFQIMKLGHRWLTVELFWIQKWI